MIPSGHPGGILVFLLVVALAGGKPASPGGLAQTAPRTIGSPGAAATAPVMVASGALMVDPPPSFRSLGAADSVAPPAHASATMMVVPAAAVAPPVDDAHRAPLAATPEPPLDLAAIKDRLRNTEAIGLFTKLALQNQVDDLLKQFREHYLSGQDTGVGHLRQPYDMLVLKVLALVQDGDPPLARTISASRETIWALLADPEQFRSTG